MSRPKGKGYKRSWKNLLLDKGYQLRFSLFMAGLSALLMFALGRWVMDVADQATKVSKQGVKVCIPPASMKLQTGSLDLPNPGSAPAEPAAVDKAAAPAPDKPAPDEPAADKPAEPAPAAPAEPAAPAKVQVTLDDKIDEAAVADMLIDVDKLVDYMNCRMITRAQLSDLDDGKRLIMWVLIAVGLVLVFGLTIYGLKMTHRVAGPLHKISLYMAKMKEGRYDTVYNLRKGDQLVDFYEHFKAAHAGLKSMQEEEIEQLRAAIEAAESAGLADKSPEIAAALDEMREVLARKEKGLE